MVSPRSSNRSADLAARLVFPAAVIIFSVLIMIAVSVIWAGGRNDRDGRALEKVAVAALAHALPGRYQTRLADAARSQETGALAALTAGPEAFDAVGRADGAETSLLALRPAAAQGQWPQRLKAAAAAPGGLAPVYFQAGDSVVLAVRAPAAGGHVAIGLRGLDAQLLLRLGNELGLAGLNIVPASGGGIARAKAPIPGLDTAALAWKSRDLGTRMLHDVLPVVIFGACILLFFTVLVFMHIRKVIVEMLAAEQHAKHLAGHDTLTGLANRMSFMEQLRKELARLPREDNGMAVLFIDLDKFKDVNDTLGHGAGDRLLINVARRLNAQLRGADTLARLGGDEFAIVQTQVRGIGDCEALARRLLDAVRAPFDLDGTEAYIGLSIGIVMAPQNGNVAEDLMRYADVALYRSKAEGRNRFSFFETRMDDSVRLRKLVETDLRNAIENDQMTLLYQPQVTADGSRIVAVEALVRWDHPEQGLIGPDRFIPLAEERGLIVPLGEWVLRRALTDARNWPGIAVSINVSAVQFKQRDFVATVARAIAETGFDASRLEIELTESVVVQDADGAEEAIMELRAMGVRLALDDFGTGYSSLIYLRRFAFDKIKIDKSFLESMEATGESAILVHSVVHLGRALGLTVTAEGVETDEQQRFLQAVGCHQLQGFFFSRPAPAGEITRMLACGQIGPAVAA